jgi:CHAD domain-containing protein
MADGKWIGGLDAEMHPAQAARHVLAVRLEVVRRRLRPALDEPDHDPQHVHQLRVATRRADAALRIFEDCLPRKACKRARKRLKRLRRAAGAVRDWDVFLADLQSRGKRPRAAELPGMDLLAGISAGQRAAAHQGLVDAGEGHLADLDGLIAATVESVRPSPGAAAGETLLNRGRQLLGCLLGELERSAAGDLQDDAQLHQVRIAGKRLRYAMEVFIACYPPFFAGELYPRVEQMQEMLGTANDSRVAGDRLDRLAESLAKRQPQAWRRWKAGVEALRRFHTRRLTQQRRNFLRWWKEWTGPATRERWALLIGAPATV